MANKNNSISPYVRLQLDDSFLDRCFQQLEGKLQRHEEMILELQRLLKNKLDRSDLESFRETFIREIDGKIQLINGRLDDLEDRLNTKILNLSDKFDNDLNEATNALSLSVDKRLKELEAKIPNLDDLDKLRTAKSIDPDDILNRFEKIEGLLENEIDKNKRSQDNIKKIIYSIGLLNNSPLSQSDLEELFVGPKTTANSNNKIKDKKNNKELNSINKQNKTNGNKETINSDNNNSNNNNTGEEKSDKDLNENGLNNSNEDDVVSAALNNSTKYVNEELQRIMDEVGKVRDELRIQQIVGKRDIDAKPPPQIPSPSSPPLSPPHHQNLNQNGQAKADNTSQKNSIATLPPTPKTGNATTTTTTNGGGTKTIVKPVKVIKMKSGDGGNSALMFKGHNEFDFSSVRPYDAVQVHWRDPPDMPALTPFSCMGDFVDYFYRLLPKLQAHLTAIQKKVVENASELIGKVDKDLVERMFERFQEMVGELQRRLGDLKDAVEQTATREEINRMVDEMIFHMNNVESETAIGRVRCIACGRDTSIVAGAKTEAEIQRIMGLPPNSIAHLSNSILHNNGNNNINTTNMNNSNTNGGIVQQATFGVSYSRRDGFDSDIVESPRSLRPFRPTVGGFSPNKQTKIKTTKVPRQ